MRHLEAKIALAHLGTGAIPVLVEGALATDKDTTLRRLLRGLARTMEDLFPLGSFPPPGRRASEALSMLGSLRPSVGMLGPWVEEALQGAQDSQLRAVHVLATGLEGETALPQTLVQLILRGATRSNAVREIIADIPRISPEQLGPIIAAVSDPTRAYPALGLLSRAGPGGSNAVPALESLLAGMDEAMQLRAALVLLEVVPEHPVALARVRQWCGSNPFNPWNQMTQATTATLCREARGFLWISHPVSVDAFVHFARLETEGWEPKGLAHAASAALERVAPERADPLYRVPMSVKTNRETVRIIAAGSLLRVQPTNQQAFEVLREFANTNGHLARMAARELGEAGSNFTAALESLTVLATSSPQPEVRSAAKLSLKQIELRSTTSRRRALSAGP
ncbi:hypothetical protein [Methanothrix soehngenii]|uniref:hypothetical protein n=1 Tax=Methanothrix soehngenii TaxID=2223 RepID=UPI00300D6C14